MRGSLPTEPLRAALARRFQRPGYGIAEYADDWVTKFPGQNPRTVRRFIERVMAGDSATITSYRADEAAIALGLMPTDIWGEDWWARG